MLWLTCYEFVFILYDAGQLINVFCHMVML